MVKSSQCCGKKKEKKNSFVGFDCSRKNVSNCDQDIAPSVHHALVQRHLMRGMHGFLELRNKPTIGAKESSDMTAGCPGQRAVSNTFSLGVLTVQSLLILQDYMLIKKQTSSNRRIGYTTYGYTTMDYTT